MSSSEEVYSALTRGVPACHRKLFTDGERLFHYSTCIAWYNRDAAEMWVCEERISVTTTRHLNALMQRTPHGVYILPVGRRTLANLTVET